MAKKKKTNPRKLPVTKADINRAKKDAKKEASILNITIVAMALHDVYGFGPKRLEQTVSRILKLYHDIDADLISINDTMQWFTDYTGMKINEREEN